MERSKSEKGKHGFDSWNMLRHELADLDKDDVEVDGMKLKPSQCFRITNNSLRIIYNTTCPDSLKEKIESILAKYSDQDENYPLEQE